MKLTEQQKESIEVLKKRWESVSRPQSLPGSDDGVTVQVTSDRPCKVSMTLGIEADGYIHS